jgi:hypothetical protein
LEIDVIESQQTFSALCAIAEADLAEADLGNFCRNISREAVDRDWTQLAAGTTGVRREASVDRNRELTAKFLNVRTH